MLRFLPLVLASLLLIGAGPAFALEGIHAGVKGGLNIANQSTDADDMELSDSRNGMALGAWVRLPATPMFSIQPEALFTMKGDSEEAGGATGTMKVDYLEVPVLAKVALAPHTPAQPSLFFGPAFGFNVSAKAEMDGTGLLDGEIDVKDNTSSMDLGLVVGGGLEFNNFGLDVRYTLGLSNVNDSGSDTEVKNNVLSIMGSFGFL